MTNESTLNMSNISQTGTEGSMASAVYLNLGSTLNASSSSFTKMSAPDSCKFENSGVIVAEFAESVSLENTSITNSDCTYVYSDRTPVKLDNSLFSSGLRKPYILVKDSSIEVKDTTFSDSVFDSISKGRGLSCIDCTSVDIVTSTFSGLKGYMGGALYLKDSNRVTLTKNTF